ncbi:membrane protein [Siccirubricoccus deserti]|uniref:OmpA family protein n=1 Tax=Siccirubricoccus deserti TaxID=2013562 RepID=A0A9X0R2X2_9PROT|nr:OmpA family protein [Siccirubricoccus deserti]MBC4017342.1 OmpA family protein [Siccirubricoccus deserti]GGC58698.1 membrane protein [Siccirubricoccus deserti]
MSPASRAFLRLCGLALAVSPLLLTPPAAAQRGSDPSVNQLIDQLRPGQGTRGIRLPSEAPPPAANPAVAASRTAPTELPAASLRVQFATGSANLTPAAERTLETLGRALTSNDLQQFRFRIEGHTDTMGDAEVNRTLSERRALTVRDFLVTRFGVAAARLEPVGLGEAQPLVATGDEVAEARNRRVQIVNIGG